MPRWRDLYNGKHLGAVDADENSAIAEAAKVFHITPARRLNLVATGIETKRDK
jgi:hypothetical protein